MRKHVLDAAQQNIFYMEKDGGNGSLTAVGTLLSTREGESTPCSKVCVWLLEAGGTDADAAPYVYLLYWTYWGVSTSVYHFFFSCAALFLALDLVRTASTYLETPYLELVWGHI